MDDRENKFDASLLEILKSLDVRSDIKDMSVRQAKLERELEKLNKSLEESASEKALSLEIEEEKKELERESGETLARLEDKLDNVDLS